MSEATPACPTGRLPDNVENAIQVVLGELPPDAPTGDIAEAVWMCEPFGDELDAAVCERIESLR